jgi:hypothetical protein
VASHARLVHKSGELPVMLSLTAAINQRLGVPFYYTSFINAHGVKLVLLLPIFILAVPLLRVLPRFYLWYVRRRVLYWYFELKELDRSLENRNSQKELAIKRNQIELIEAGVKRIRLPLDFADHVDDLREYIHSLKQRIASQGETRIAVE